MNQITTIDKNGFEAITCSRCGGSGAYSWNARDGDKCYQCRRKGFVYTKRGQTARQYWIDSMSKKAVDLEIGDMVNIGIVDIRYMTLTEKIENKNGSLNLIFAKNPNNSYAIQNTKTDEVYLVGYTAVQKKIKLQEAIEYQATL